MTVEVIPYKKGHADFIDPDEVHTGDGDPAFITVHDNIAEDEHTWCRTLLYNKKVVALFGGAVRWSGMAEIWSIPTIHIRPIAKSYFQTMFDQLEKYEVELNIRRYQTCVRYDYVQNQKFMELLGFEKECLMRKFGPKGEDYFLYARLK